MNYKACKNCPHLNNVPPDANQNADIIIFCDLRNHETKSSYDPKSETFSLDDIAWGYMREMVANEPMKYNPDFIPPQECPYILEHTVNKDVK